MYHEMCTSIIGSAVLYRIWIRVQVPILDMNDNSSYGWLCWRFDFTLYTCINHLNISTIYTNRDTGSGHLAFKNQKSDILIMYWVAWWVHLKFDAYINYDIVSHHVKITSNLGGPIRAIVIYLG